jgi:hypothetical protein
VVVAAVLSGTSLEFPSWRGSPRFVAVVAAPARSIPLGCLLSCRDWSSSASDLDVDPFVRLVVLLWLQYVVDLSSPWLLQDLSLLVWFSWLIPDTQTCSDPYLLVLLLAVAGVVAAPRDSTVLVVVAAHPCLPFPSCGSLRLLRDLCSVGRGCLLLVPS